MMKLIIYGLVIYLLYKVIFEVVVPVSKGVKTVKRNMEQMQRQQAEAFRNAQQAAGHTNGPSAAQGSATQNAPKKEVQVDAEYIEFEEVKKK
jgi:Sec-independent protein translocase protein TatA